MKFTVNCIPRRFSLRLGALTLLVLLTLGGCAPSGRAPAPDSATLQPAASARPDAADDAQLVLGMPASEQTVNPYQIVSYKTQSVLGLVYETMLTLDAQGNPQPGLCESWQVQQDGSVLFSVRKNVTFHNGETLTAQHMVDALTYIRDTAPQGACGGVLSYVRSWRLSPDGQGLILVPHRGLYSMLCALTVPIADLGETISGTGPYRITGFTAGQGMTLARYDAWWRIAPQFAVIQVNAYQDDDDQLRSLALGQMDLAYTRDMGVSAYKSTAGFTALSVQTGVFDFLALNLRAGAPMADRALRSALFSALDTKSLIQSVYQNNAVAAETPVTSSHWLYDGTLPVHEASLDAARSALKQSVYQDHNDDGFLDVPDEQGQAYVPLTLRILVASDSAETLHSELAQKVTQTLESIGILSETVFVSGEKLEQTLREGGFDIAVLSADVGALPDLSFLYGSDGALNFGGYASAQMDELLLQARQAGTPGDLTQCYRQICQLALEDLPVVGVGMRCCTLLYDSAIKGIGSVHYTSLFANIDDWHRVEP
jgi:peptide/nickel transport system substrate-binding protein